MRKIIPMIAALAATALWAGSALAQELGDEAILGAGALTDSANVGSGKQINANDWEDMADVNAGGNQLTGGGLNNNAGHRTSNDVVITAGMYPLLASAALAAEVSGNELMVTGDGATANSSIEFTDASGFMSSYGVTAVAINSGAHASQSVSVNVMSEVAIGYNAGN